LQLKWVWLVAGLMSLVFHVTAGALTKGAVDWLVWVRSVGPPEAPRPPVGGPLASASTGPHPIARARQPIRVSILAGPEPVRRRDEAAERFTGNAHSTGGQSGPPTAGIGPRPQSPKPYSKAMPIPSADAGNALVKARDRLPLSPALTPEQNALGGAEELHEGSEGVAEALTPEGGPSEPVGSHPSLIGRGVGSPIQSCQNLVADSDFSAFGILPRRYRVVLRGKVPGERPQSEPASRLEVLSFEVRWAPPAPYVDSLLQSVFENCIVSARGSDGAAPGGLSGPGLVRTLDVEFRAR
jgi:hypothetical protein